MSWIVPAALGAYHGLNPAMGWLFAVALGLQERRAGAVLRALPPIALGHAASVATVVTAVAAARLVVPDAALRAAGALLLLGFAAALIGGRLHPRPVGMRVGARGLAVWSFIMSSAHGAGLMLLPIVIGGSGGGADMAHAHAHAAGVGVGAHMLAIHTCAMFAAMAAAALFVFHIVGVDFLRRAWLNTDTLWAAALAASAFSLLVTA